ncbi:RutC family protein YjgH [Pigmentiphaga humi]|uniref:RutC family protein YjgH n=1 Tax=Pigmentiphaga humi TaxID=2478468 RepID=A0A3P4AYY4_9BURK|nr:RidA family protein [Pigmentiphaga humi]VCU68781.1 RutC family protein YjgH [Pigmentiphaga humi]
MQIADFPLPFPRAPYSRAMFDNDWVFVSGTIGMDYTAQELAPTVQEQTRLMLRNISAYLAATGAKLEDIVNYTLIIDSMEHVHPVIEVLADELPCKPTGTAMIAGIAYPGAHVEMQVIARKQGGKPAASA